MADTTQEEIFTKAQGHAKGLLREYELEGTPLAQWLASLIPKDPAFFPYVVVYSMFFPDPKKLRKAYSLIAGVYTRSKWGDESLTPYHFESVEDYDAALMEFSEAELEQMGDFFLKHNYCPTAKELLGITQYGKANGFVFPEYFLPVYLEDYEKVVQTQNS